MDRRIKLLFVFGTRPEAIKMLPIVHYAQKYFSDKFTLKTCVTGQHRKMLDDVLSLFEITPNYDLNIMTFGQDLYNITAKILLGVGSVLTDYDPDCVLVQGDTTTTLAASLASYYQHIPLAHVEAGLRTNDIYRPWPEEINRKIVDSIAQFLFAPTENCKTNLNLENITKNVVVVGNSVIDALLWAAGKINDDNNLNTKLNKKFTIRGIDFSKKIILITGHRRESFGNDFVNICQAIKEIALSHPDVQLVYPVHLNPNVQKPVNDILSDILNVHLIEPQNYLSFIYLMQKTHIILTDSGGIQEEAPSLKKPVLVIRDTTERSEAIKDGTAKLVGTNKDSIISAVEELLTNNEKYQSMIRNKNPYGNGTTSQLILDYLLKKLF